VCVDVVLMPMSMHTVRGALPLPGPKKGVWWGDDATIEVVGNPGNLVKNYLVL
jgi:hypothetical protein